MPISGKYTLLELGKRGMNMAELALKDLLYEMKNAEYLVEEDELEYSKKIEAVAKKVCDSENIRILLIAGPSASGKTTTASLISDKIKSLGEKSIVVSLDNFYRNADDKKYPRMEDGSPDYESPYALDTDLLLKTIGDIIAGRTFDVPKYDFKIGKRTEIAHYSSFADGCVILEGIHGLNPIFSDPFPKENVLKVFISVSTNINEDGKRILSGRKLRFVRRMVRDNLYRGTDAYRTISMWLNVLKGEDTYLYPYKKLADFSFDTFHKFEPAVMKTYTDKLLTEEVCAYSEYANTVAKALKKIPSLDSNIVPDSSLIREFIPGGMYEDLY